MIRAVIVDDEDQGREAIEILLGRYCPQVKLVGIASSVDEAISVIRSEKPDLVFLDIEMPSGSGFDVLENTKDLRFEVIFTTAYDHYAFKAFRFSALDYLLKPIDIKDLINAVCKMQERTVNWNRERFNEEVSRLISGIVNTRSRKVQIPTSDNRILFIESGDIIRFRADGNYTHIHHKEGKVYMVAKTLKEYENMLGEDQFFRIHHAHLINVNYISTYHKGDSIVTMVDGSLVEVSSRRKKEFLSRISITD
jgi:two-component system, LytTR family, response regulator